MFWDFIESTHPFCIPYFKFSLIRIYHVRWGRVKHNRVSRLLQSNSKTGITIDAFGYVHSHCTQSIFIWLTLNCVNVDRELHVQVFTGPRSCMGKVECKWLGVGKRAGGILQKGYWVHGGVDWIAGWELVGLQGGVCVRRVIHLDKGEVGGD